MASRKGFTIVELLIVVVVIAILAAITIVSYNGIASQAHDAAIKSDLATLKNKIEIYSSQEGDFPITNNAIAQDVAPFRAAKGSYMTAGVTDHNLIYCTSYATIGAGQYERIDYSFVAYSKSGKKFRVTKSGGVEEYTTAWTNQTVACQDAMSSYTNNFRGYAAEDTVGGPWRAWTGGN